MIVLKDLKPIDKGKWVQYVPSCGEVEMGRIKSWNDKYIFVVFKCDGHWSNYLNYTGEACDPKDLVWR